MKIENMKLADLKPYEGNAKKHDEKQIKNVMESIKQYGIVQPLVADKNNVLIIGHCRLIASKRLKLQTVPVVRLEDLTEDEANKLRLLDNKLNESEWDWDLLAEQIPALDFSGFDIDWELPELPKDEIEIQEDEIPEEPATIAKKGDLWILGRHKLLCGDSTDAENIARLTDPPYNVALGQHMRPSEAKQLHRRTDGLVIDNDHFESDAAFIEFLYKAFSSVRQHLKPGGAFYIWYSTSQTKNFIEAAEKAGWKIRQTLVWNKNTFVLGRQDYQWKHEPCLYGWEDGAAHYFVDDRTQPTVLQDKEEIEPRKMKKEELIKLVEEMLAERIPTTVINEAKPARSEEHPTMKPLRLIGRQIKNSSRPGELVVDIFGGSGSTLIAAEQLQRRCNTCELDPHYADVIIQRYINLTNNTADAFCIRDGARMTYEEAKEW